GPSARRAEGRRPGEYEPRPWRRTWRSMYRARSGTRSRDRDRRCRCRRQPPRPSWPPRCTSCRASSASVQHLEAHRPGGALDHLHGGFAVISVEVLALHLDDLPDLRSRDAADLLAVRLGRSLLDAGGALEEL